jgi:hypothetical protein
LPDLATINGQIEKSACALRRVCCRYEQVTAHPEVIAVEAERTINMKKEDKRTSLEKYLLMSEQEKDAEIQRAVARLQKRIQEILYLLEAEKVSAVARQDHREKKDTVG